MVLLSVVAVEGREEDAAVVEKEAGRVGTEGVADEAVAAVAGTGEGAGGAAAAAD